MIDSIKRYTRKNNGGTFTPEGVAIFPAMGYAVGGLNYETVHTTLGQEFEDSVLYAMDLAGEFNAFVGTWLDTDTGLWYVDLSRIYKSKERAISQAIAAGEKAIFDFSTGESIYVEEVA